VRQARSWYGSPVTGGKTKLAGNELCTSVGSAATNSSDSFPVLVLNYRKLIFESQSKSIDSVNRRRPIDRGFLFAPACP